MYSLIIYLNKLFNSYNSCFDFYLKELSMYISLLEAINFLILCLIFIFLFIRFIIIRYTFKKIIFFIIKRLIFSFLFFFIFYTFSDSLFCYNSVNNSISKLFDTNTKKVCIATIAITGCYLSYKYVPIYYKTVISHKKYIDYLKEKSIYDDQFKNYNVQINNYNLQTNEYNTHMKEHEVQMQEYNMNIQQYNTKMQEYDVYLKSRESLNTQNNLIAEYNSNIKIFNKFLHNIDINFKKLFGADKLDLFLHNPVILAYNGSLNYFKNTITNRNIIKNDYDDKFLIIANNIEKSSVIIDNLVSHQNYKYKIKKSFILNQETCFNDFNNLINFYTTKVIPILKKFTKNDSLDFNPESILSITTIMNEVDILIDKSVDSSNLMYSNCKSIKNLVILVEPVDLITPNLWYQKVIEKPIMPSIEKPIMPSIEKPIRPSIEKPIDLEPIDFPLENLEGFRYIGINIGYVVFYPILYSSNKILGTCNPLSSQSFMDAISNLISLIKFF